MRDEGEEPGSCSSQVCSCGATRGKGGAGSLELAPAGAEACSRQRQAARKNLRCLTAGRTKSHLRRYFSVRQSFASSTHARMS